METVLVALGVSALVTVGLVVGAVALAVHLLRARNRVSARARSTAPIHWLWSWRLAARLHRRLRATVAAAKLACAGERGLGLDEIVSEIDTRAVELDRQLVVASRASSRSRPRMLRELAAEVRELEAIAERTVRLTRAWSGAVPSERGLSVVRERLDALEGALRELDGIEQLPDLPERRAQA